MKTSTLLTRSIKHLRSHPDRVTYGVCAAVTDVLNSMQLYREANCAAQTRFWAHIRARTDGFVYAHHWLARTVLKASGVKRVTYEEREKWIAAQDPKAINEWRIQWVRHMIAHFKARGD